MYELSKALKKHPNRCFVFYLLMGLINGFLVDLSHLPDFSFSYPNLQSARKEPQVVDELLAKEVNKGYMIGPFNKPPFNFYFYFFALIP